MTIPTPERAAELLGARGEELATRYRLRRPQPGRRKPYEWVLAALVLLLSVSLGVLLGYLYFRPHI